jgi:hypothetical protein
VLFLIFLTQQILPRLRTDFPCANKYQQTGRLSNIRRYLTTWNVTWFGDETNSPAAGKEIQMHLQKKQLKCTSS